jgi:hypothetical protein
VPVSKKRKKRTYSGPPPPKNKTPAPKKLTAQKVLIYIISALMILSLAIGFLASGSGRQATPTPVPQENILVVTPAPEDQSGDEEVVPTAEVTAEPASEN